MGHELSVAKSSIELGQSMRNFAVLELGPMLSIVNQIYQCGSIQSKTDLQLVNTRQDHLEFTKQMY